MQIRNMRLVYSRAETTYGWLGKERAGNTISFLVSLTATALEGHSHTCTSIAPNPSTPGQGLDSPSACLQCATHSRIDGVRGMLQNSYWKRRWIIQETSVSPRHILFCGDEAITLNDFERSVKLCVNSPYWKPNLDQEYSWFHTILAFRSSYKAAKQPLINAIERTRMFESTDPRDAIFSLLGICHDGSELVPTPNYSESFELILIDFTRALVKKYKSLDMVFSSEIVRTGSEALPSWVPNWLSEQMPLKAYSFDASSPHPNSTAFFYSRYECLGSPVEFRGALRVPGVAIGRIASATSSTNPASLRLEQPQQASPFRSYQFLQPNAE